ncbi:MAG: TetR/AcrR family transcriptional regulator [Propionibacteriaceae bacterium]
MPAPLRTSRASWIQEGLLALTTGGPESVLIERIAKALGVTKGGFYGHFRDRQAFLDAMLDNWEETFVDQAIELADHGGGSGRTRLRRLFATVSEREGIMDLELSVRNWARRDPAVAARVTRVDDRRLAYLRPLFAEFCDDDADVEGRCLLVLTLFVGAPFVVATHGEQTRSSVMAAATRHLLRVSNGDGSATGVADPTS